MKTNWPAKKLRDPEICSLIMGQSPPSSSYNSNGDGLPFFQGKKDFGQLYPTPSVWCSNSGKIAEPNDVLISVRAPVGPVNLCKEKSVIGRGLAALRPNSANLNYQFLFLFLKSIENKWEGFGGAVFAAITKKDLGEFEIPVPPIEEQKRIVAKLEKILSKIQEAKNLREETFDGTETFLSSAFDKCLPKMGNPKKLGEITEITDFVANGSFASLKENVRYKKTEDFAILLRLVDNSRKFTGKFVYIDETAYSFLSKSKLKPGDLILSNVGANLGTVFKVPDLKKPMSLGPNSVVIKANRYLQNYLYCWFRSSLGKKAIRSIVTGSGQPKFNKTDLKTLDIPIPSVSEQEKIVTYLDGLSGKVQNLKKLQEEQLLELESLKQSVLHQAFQGKLV
jgi:type I restriction enzyme S subunit